MNTRSILPLVLLSLALIAQGCSDSLQDATPLNTPPETELRADPPRDADDGRAILFLWSGSDSDGQVRSYEYRLVDGSLQPALVPWDASSQQELDLQFTASEIAALGGRTLRFEVRAVDDRGAVDPSPAVVAFSPLTLAPTVMIDFPLLPPTNTCSQLSTTPTFGWSATDPDGKGGVPVATRYLVLEQAGPTCLTRTEFEADNPILKIATDDPRWSPWVDYDPSDDLLGPSRSIRLPAIAPGMPMLFAVQARDAEGSITKDFGWGRNVIAFIASEGLFPVLSVYEPLLGRHSFVSLLGERTFQVVGGEMLAFEWTADASQYGGIIDAFRFGWDLLDPDDPNDPGWLVEWGNGPQWRQAPPRSFVEGTHRFVVQVRDKSGNISRATYYLAVHQQRSRDAQRDVLLVDDWPGSGNPTGQLIDEEWDQRWAQLLGSIAPGFDPMQDVIDAEQDPLALDLALLLQYKSVIWFVGPSDFTFLHSRLAPRSRADLSYNWLEAYQRRGGNLLLVGPGAMRASLEGPPPLLLQPIFLDIPAGGQLGLGVTTLPSGQVVNTGTLRWPYRGFCLESVDFVRPPLGQVFGEAPGQFARSTVCDALYAATVRPEFEQLVGADVLVVLRPSPERQNLDAAYKFAFEEFYNVDVAGRPETLTLLDCQVPMFAFVARRDAGAVSDPGQSCPPSSTGMSPLDAVPIAIMSTAHSQSKPLVGSADFVWGFHPLAFDPSDVAVALRWIFGVNWRIQTAP